LIYSHLTPGTQFLASNLHSREELCCKKVIINAFEQPLQQGFFNLKKAGKGRLLDTLPKPGNHPGVGFCSAWLSLLPKRELVGGLKYIWLFCEKPAPRCCRLSDLIQ
jgi:hypothetical protein